MNKYVFLLIITLFLSCNDDEGMGTADPVVNNENTTKFELMVNDDEFEFEEENLVYRILNTLNVQDAENGSVTLGFLFESQADPELGKINFIGAIQNWKWQMPQEKGILEKKYDTYWDQPGSNTECQEIETELLCDGIQFIVTKFSTPDPSTGRLDNSQYLFGTESGDSNGTFTITGINTEELTFSGSFDNVVFRRGMFDAEAEAFFPETITISGSFTDMPYSL